MSLLVRGARSMLVDGEWHADDGRYRRSNDGRFEL
jgi:hypothetical protein